MEPDRFPDYSVDLLLDRRIAFFFSIRRSSLLEMNQRLRRTVLRTPLFTTFLRKRLSSESCDSFGRNFTLAKNLTSLQRWNISSFREADIGSLSLQARSVSQAATKPGAQCGVYYTPDLDDH